MINLNDIIITKKAHACGNSEWTVIRTGADVKLKCNNCGRIVLLPLDKVKKLIKEIK